MNINTSYFLPLAAASVMMLAACAGQPETYTMNSGQSVTMPKGTMTGGASVGDANALAQMVADGNTNAMTQFDKLGGDMTKMQATGNQELQNSSRRSRNSSSSPTAKVRDRSRYSSPRVPRSSIRSSSSA